MASFWTGPFLVCWIVMKNPLEKEKYLQKDFLKKFENFPEKNIKHSKPFESFKVIWNLIFSPSANHGGQHFFEILFTPTILVLLQPSFISQSKGTQITLTKVALVWSTSKIFLFIWEFSKAIFPRNCEK